MKLENNKLGKPAKLALFSAVLSAGLIKGTKYALHLFVCNFF